MALMLVPNLPDEAPENDFEAPDEDSCSARSFFDLSSDDPYLNRFFSLYLRDSRERGFGPPVERMPNADALLASIESRIIRPKDEDPPMAEKHVSQKDRIREALTERPGMTGAELAVRVGIPKVPMEVLLCQLVRARFLRADGIPPRRHYLIGAPVSAPKLDPVRVVLASAPRVDASILTAEDRERIAANRSNNKPGTAQAAVMQSLADRKPSTLAAPPDPEDEPEVAEVPSEPAPAPTPSMKVRVPAPRSMPPGWDVDLDRPRPLPKLPVRIPENPPPMLPPETDVETMLENRLKDVQRRREALAQTALLLDREASRLSAALTALRAE